MDLGYKVCNPTKPDKDLSHTHRPSAPIIEDWVSDSEDDSNAEITQNALSFVQPTEQVKNPRSSIKTIETSIQANNHKTSIPKPKSNGYSRNRKACFVCKSLDHLIKDCNFYEKKMAQTPIRNHDQRGNHQQYATMTLPNPQRHVVLTTVLTKSKLVLIKATRPVTAAVPKPHVTRPRQAKTIITKPYSPPRRTINRSPSPKASTFPSKVTTAKAPMVNAVKGNWGNPQHALKDKGVIDSGCSRHMTGNMSYLPDFKELNGGYVAFGGNPKGGKISSKEFKLPDENQVLLRVPRENNMYNVDLKNIVPSGDLTCLFAKATLDEVLVTKPQNKTPYELLLGQTLSIGFMRSFGYLVTILNTLDTLENQSNPSAGVQEQFSAEKAGEETVQHYVLFLVWSFGFTNPQNTDDDATFGGKKPEFKGRKPESEVHVSPSSSAQTKKHDDKTKREAKGKSPVESSTGYRNLSAEFEDFTDNSINEVNAVDSPVPAVGLTHGKSSYMNTSQYLDDPNMPKLEDITYSVDEEDVGAEADFTNLETTISVSPIPITKVHKNHHVTQIISDLSSATQTRSMPRVAKDQALKDPSWIEAMLEELLQFKMQKVWVLVDLPNGKRAIGFEDPDHPDKVYKVVKALYRLHQAPRAWYETLANYLLENGFQRGKIDQTLFIKKQKGDILLVQIYVDDIIFGSPNKDLCKAFEKLMKDKFQMSVKENQEKDKIGSKPDKNRKRGEARKILKQLQ
nr:putative ribonuclease H-like domain-containing protein [Tanacetum cinerariifolium]